MANAAGGRHNVPHFPHAVKVGYVHRSLQQHAVESLANARYSVREEFQLRGQVLGA